MGDLQEITRPTWSGNHVVLRMKMRFIHIPGMFWMFSGPSWIYFWRIFIVSFYSLSSLTHSSNFGTATTGLKQYHVLKAKNIHSMYFQYIANCSSSLGYLINTQTRMMTRSTSILVSMQKRKLRFTLTELSPDRCVYSFCWGHPKTCSQSSIHKGNSV